MVVTFSSAGGTSAVRTDSFQMTELGVTAREIAPRSTFFNAAEAVMWQRSQ